MKIGDDYMVESAPSIFVSRKGKKDVNIYRCTHKIAGILKADGRYYEIIAKFCAETGETLRLHAPMPPEISLPMLKQWGFVNP